MKHLKYSGMVSSKTIPIWVSVLFFVIVLEACKPKETVINPPYTDQDISLSELITKAKEQCQRRLGPGNQPVYAFTTDGCSASPDGDWRSCCVVHDISYWCGGTATMRLQADRELRSCVTTKGHDLYASVVFMGVRVGGHPLMPFPWRWGYGWDWPRAYDEKK